MIQIVTEKGRKMALVPLAQYKRMVADLEAREDARDVSAARAIMARVKAGQESLIPFSVVTDTLAGTNRVKAWRNHRALTAAALAGKAGISRAYLTQIESGNRTGTAGVLRRLADALGTGIDALVD